MKRILTLAAAAVLLMSLSACQLFVHDYKEDVLEYAMIANDGSELSVLDQYPCLEYVDLRGSTCYEAILDYAASHPDVKVRFSIGLGSQFFNQDIAQITLSGEDADFDDLMNNLKYFRFAESVHIEKIGMTKAQFDELAAAYPDIDFSYTVQFGDEIAEAGVTALNLSHLDAADVDRSVMALEFLPELRNVDFMSASGTAKLSAGDVKKFIQAYPHLSFNYQFRLFGQDISIQTEKLVYKDTNIGAGGLDQIRDALAVMPNCTYVCLDNCRIDNEAMGQLREEFPDKTIVWRVFVDVYSVLTDTEVVLMKNTVSDKEAQPLKYCTNVKYLDMSGCKIRDFSFLAAMPNLECVVLQQSYISDLSVLQGCSNLTWLDLAGCTSLKDASPLSGISSLKYLNLSSTKVKDLSPLDQLPLERFKCAKCSFDAAELRQFESKHPNCLTTNTGNIVGMGWRFNDASQREPFEYYAKMTEIFGYTK